MSRKIAIECEVCDKTVTLKTEEDLPGGWLVLHEPYQECCWHFCSREHLGQYLGVTEPTQPLEQPQTKMRRFILVDEQAEEFEGVLWGNGCVALTPENVGYLQNRTWSSWDNFKHDNQGCGVTWIDQEVKEEVGNHA